MQRRTFLKSVSALGLVSSLPACRTSNRDNHIEHIPGRILGSNHQAGHRIRDRLPNTKTNTGEPKTLRTSVVILGGGVAGLSAARRLAKSGLDDFLVFELEDHLGGNSRCQVYPESAAPWAAHYLPVPTKESALVREILSEMGVLRGVQADGTPIYREEDLCHAPTERLFHLGTWQEGLFPKDGANEKDLRQLEAFHKEVERWQNFRDSQGRKAFSIPLDLSSQDSVFAELDRISVADWMAKMGWDSPALKFYIEYATRDDYGSALHNTSAWAGLHYFASRDGGGFQPADAQLVWPEGNHRLVAHLLSTISDRCHTSHMVTQLEPQPRGVEVHLLDLQEQRIVKVQAQKVIWALPQFLRPYLWAQSWDPAWNDSFVYSPWVVANLALSSIPQELPGQRPGLCWDNVIFDSSSLGYVVATHQSLKVGPSPTVLTWYKPFIESDTKASRQQILKQSWSEWRREILQELLPLHPDLVNLTRRLDVMLLGHAMIRPGPGYIFGSVRKAVRQSQRDVHFAHSDLSGISIFEEANYQGERAAGEILALLTGKNQLDQLLGQKTL